ncbi:hypoxanthine phosphoribosyltransferase [Fluviicola taffensis]|uniref:Hypoxanthine phosphoribosyltransferase n=1 Tax=Fluviicola taffensis (strain DSM 16823 / NCIMB 13979 / RW262) TaxID=755732 RepID=F2IKB0_FLUTR|nr:hypoxanthine phosphoribosyltransferase [Fluviicola taffensis DSM 16823]
MLQLNDKTFEIFIPKEDIQAEISSLAAKLEQDYAGKEVVFIAVLNGAFMFAADLMKNFRNPCEITFVKVSSYQGMHSSGRVDEVIGLNTSIKDKHVIIIEDIVDTGITMEKLFTLLSGEKPASLEIVTLLYKPEAFKGKHTPTYIGFSIPNKFVVGYGLDYNELGRNTEHIYQLKGEVSR